MTSRRLAAILAVLAGLQCIAGAASLPDLLSQTAAAWVQLIVGALSVAMATYTGRIAARSADQAA